MKFATIGHIIDKKTMDYLPKNWIKNDFIISPEKNIEGTKGYITGLNLTAYDMMNLPIDQVRQKILEAAIFVQDELNVDIIQLGALTTSVTSGGIWLSRQNEFNGFINHGDSYTAAVTCQAVEKAIKHYEKKPSDLTLSIIGAYGLIGEAVSKILVSKFKKSYLIGRRIEKLEELSLKLKGNFETTTILDATLNSDILVTATSHPKALLDSYNLKKNSIVVDVSQPPNLTKEVCQKRPDICRIDGGYVDFPKKYNIKIPNVPFGKLYSCIVEVIMQAMENQCKNYVGSIDMNHLKKTECWGKKYGFILNELTNFGNTISI